VDFEQVIVGNTGAMSTKLSVAWQLAISDAPRLTIAVR
jgi:hypothetical protein